MALGWIKGCPECTGWMLVCDVKDTVFQRPPFADLGATPPQPSQNDAHSTQRRRPDLMLFEEAHPPPLGFDNNHWFAWGSVKNCFGKAHEREIMRGYRSKAVLCSGSTIGTRAGLSRYLSAMTRRFYEMTWLGPDCVPPMAVDQPIHNMLFYTKHGYAVLPGDANSALSFGGAGGDLAVAVKFGSPGSPVQTVGRLCSMGEKQKLQLTEVAQVNLSVHPTSGLFLNANGEVAPVVHQHDRCWSLWQAPLLEHCRAVHEVLRGSVRDTGAIRPPEQVCKGG